MDFLLDAFVARLNRFKKFFFKSFKEDIFGNQDGHTLIGENVFAGKQDSFSNFFVS